MFGNASEEESHNQRPSSMGEECFRQGLPLQQWLCESHRCRANNTYGIVLQHAPAICVFGKVLTTLADWAWLSACTLGHSVGSPARIPGLVATGPLLNQMAARGWIQSAGLGPPLVAERGCCRKSRSLPITNAKHRCTSQVKGPRAPSKRTRDASRAEACRIH